MKHLVIALTVLGLAFSLAAQDTPPRDQDQPKSQDPPKDQPRAGDKGAATCELRLYVMDRERKPIDLKDVTASIAIEGKGGGPKKLMSMQLVTAPKPDEKPTGEHEGQVRQIDGGLFVAELVVMKDETKPGTGRKPGEPERKPGDPERKPGDPGAKPGDPGARPGDPGARPADPGRKPEDQDRPGATQRPSGPYYRAELKKDDLPSMDFTATVYLKKLKGETKTVRFDYPFTGDGNGKETPDKKETPEKKPPEKK